MDTIVNMSTKGEGDDDDRTQKQDKPEAEANSYPCFAFQYGRCNKSQCRFSHKCLKCGSSSHGCDKYAYNAEGKLLVILKNPGHRSGFRNGVLSGTGLVTIHPMSNSHCDVKSRGVRERPKCMLFSIEKAAPFVAQRCDAVIYPVFIYLSQCNSPDEES